MKLKVCGMKYRENMQQVAGIHPDYLGYIFYKKSARNFDGEIPQLPKGIKKVGVFVNATIPEILEKISRYNLDVIQLHGEETVAFCANLQRHIETSSVSRQIGIIKVFSIKDEFNFDILKPYEKEVDYFLFDTKGELPGGNGYAFDWRILKKYNSKKPFILSGGIGLEELDSLEKFMKSEESRYCHAIDVNSRFELKPGLKNIDKLKEFKLKIIE